MKVKERNFLDNMEKFRRYLKSIDCASVFIVGMTISIAFAFICVFINRGNGLQNVYFYDPYDTFMDFYNSVIHNRDPYTQTPLSIYPPLMYVIYLIIRHFIPIELVDAGSFALRDSQIGLMTYFIYSMILIYVFSWLLDWFYEGSKNKRKLILGCFLLSYPFVFCFERGNAIFIAFIFTLVFFLGYKSKRNVIRYVSYFALAIAAAIKIYPAIYGVLLLKKGKWKDVIICVVIGITVFFAPFLLLAGESRKIMTWINNILFTNGLFGEFGYGIRHNIVAMFEALGIFMDSNLIYVGRIVLALMVISVIWIFFKNKQMDEWKRVMLLTLLMIFIPGMSYSYVLIFLTIPILQFFNEKKEDIKKIDIFRTILMIVIFMPIITYSGRDLLGMDCKYKLYVYTILQNIALISMFVSIIAEEFFYKKMFKLQNMRWIKERFYND